MNKATVELVRNQHPMSSFIRWNWRTSLPDALVGLWLLYLGRV